MDVAARSGITLRCTQGRRKEKIVHVEQVAVKDVGKVAELPAWKAEGAMGLIKKDEGIQAVYGPKADVLKSDINDIL